jgi:alkyl hydroperoxide reductase 1
MCSSLTAATEFKNKKVVIVAVPGAFTPTCQASHLPSYINNKEKLKAQGVDQVVVIAFNDAWVMSAWGKANGISDDFFVSLTPRSSLSWLHLHCRP